MNDDELKKLDFGNPASKSWKYWVVEATRGNQTMLGAVIIAVLGRTPKNPPFFNVWATIDAEGVIRAGFVARNGLQYHDFPICHVRDLGVELNRLADHCKLDDAQRAALFEEVRKWVRSDARAKGRVVLS